MFLAYYQQVCVTPILHAIIHTGSYSEQLILCNKGEASTTRSKG